ncbi:MAG: exported protein of unknown function [Candidatus Saccharibacteria bacterium]|nr:exported protein of unknown function [Candidatus Saccharibacteria bacterium]
MKRLTITLSFVIVTTVVVVSKVIATTAPSWHATGPLYMQSLRQDTDQPCSYMQTWTHPGFTLAGCIDDYHQPIDMAFGQLSAHGKIRLGELPYYRQITLPPGYILYPLSGTDGALLVGDDDFHYPDRPIAYYPDVIAALSWPDLALRYPTPDQQFRYGDGYLYALHDSVAGSRDGRWAVAQSSSGQPVRLNLETLAVNAFAEPLKGVDERSGDTYLYLMHAAISDDGRTVFMVNPYSHESQQAALYDVSCQTGCIRQLTDYLDDALSGYVYALKPVFVTDDTLEFVGLVNDPQRGMTYNNYRLGLHLPPDEHDYLAFGDSFSSGEGAYYYRPQTDLVDNKCHNSLAAYSYILRPASHSVACSGARLKDVNGTAWGQRSGRAKSSYTDAETRAILESFLPGNVNQIEFLKKYHPRTATISIGGNDIGFADIIKQCIDPRHNWRDDATCYPTYEDRYELFQTIYESYDRLLATYRTLATASPETDIYIIGYPQLISVTGSCGVNVQLNTDERELAAELTDALNETIAKAARASGVHYVDVSDAFEGHRLCEAGQAAVNGITAGNDGLQIAGHPVLGQETFHPTAFGQKLLAEKIDRATHNFSLIRIKVESQEAPRVSPLKPALSTVKQVNRLIRRRSPSSTITTDKAKKKLVVTSKHDAKKLKPKQAVTVAVADKKITTTTDDTGEFNLTIDIGDITHTGYYEVHIYGTDPFDELIDIVKTAWLERADDPDDPQLTVQVNRLASGGV